MDENVVYTPKPTQPLPSPQRSSQPVSSMQQPTPPSQPPPAIRRSFLSKGLLIGIIAAFIIVVLLIFGVRFLLGMVSSNAQEVTLTYWGLWEDPQVMQPLIAEFEKNNPNITIKYEKRDPDRYKESLVTRIQNGTGPDIYRYHNTWVPMLGSMLSPLSTDVITAEEFKKVYYPVIQQDLIQNGGIYGIPLGIDTLAMFVNTEILVEAGITTVPQNVGEFVSAAKRVTVPDESGTIKTAGAALGTMNNISHAPDILSYFLVLNGANVRNINQTTTQTKGTLDFYTGFTDGSSKTWDASLDPSVIAFAKGNLAIFFGYSWDIFTIKELNKELTFSVHPLPTLLGRRVTIASYWVEGISSKSKNQKEALLFMKYLAKKETQQKFYTEVAKTRLFGEPYARRDLADSLKDNNLLYPFVSQASYATSSYFVSDTHDDGENPGINSRMNQYLTNAVNSLLQKSVSEETVVETLGQGVDQVLQQYGQ